jgi:hypothetical protein
LEFVLICIIAVSVSSEEIQEETALAAEGVGRNSETRGKRFRDGRFVVEEVEGSTSSSSSEKGRQKEELIGVVEGLVSLVEQAEEENISSVAEAVAGTSVATAATETSKSSAEDIEMETDKSVDEICQVGG